MGCRLLLMLGLVGLASACLEIKSTNCGNGAFCPSDMVCVGAPVYCATPEEVAACSGVGEREECSHAAAPHGLCVSDACKPCSPDRAGCEYVGWKAMTSPAVADLVALSVLSMTEAYAADADGKLLAYDGERWSELTEIPGGANATVISLIATKQGSDSTTVFALLNDNNQIHRYRGGSWSEITPSGGDGLKAMWGVSDDDVFAVGFGGQILHFDGSSWSDVPSGTLAPLHAIWGTSANDIFAVGNSGTVLHYDGAMWRPETNPPALTSERLLAVWGTGDEAFAVGEGGAILHRVNGAWSARSLRAPLVSPEPPVLVGVWGARANDVFAVSEGGKILHWNGRQWRALKRPSSGGLRAIAGVDARHVLAVGQGGGIERYSGSAWSEVDVLPTASYRGVWGIDEDDVLVVGSAGLHRLDPMTDSWQPVSSVPSSCSSALRGVWARSAAEIYVVGDVGRTCRGDGTTWTAATVPGSERVDAVFGTDADAFAGGQGLFGWTGAGWIEVGPSLEPLISGMWSDGQALHIAGGGLHVFEGSALVEQRPASELFHAIWGRGDERYAVGPGGRIAHFTQSAGWTDVASPTGEALHAVTGTGELAFAVGDNATVLRLRGGRWRAVEPPPISGDPPRLHGAWAGGQLLYVVGDGVAWRLITSPR
jgi:hypothetical protein